VFSWLVNGYVLWACRRLDLGIQNMQDFLLLKRQNECTTDNFPFASENVTNIGIPLYPCRAFFNANS